MALIIIICMQIAHFLKPTSDSINTVCRLNVELNYSAN